MHFRPLDPIADRALVAAFFDEIADYIYMERDEAPDDAAVTGFFTEAPPGCDPADSHRIGLFLQGNLAAIAEMALGYPSATDAYLGFLTVAARARNHGAGVALLRHLEAIARSAGMTSLYLGVLDANHKGRAFWEREGFAVTLADQSITLGRKTQIAHRMGKRL